MALTNAERQRRYKARHFVTDAAAGGAPQNGTAPPGVAPDLTAVRAALQHAQILMTNTAPYPGMMFRQLQSLLKTLEALVEALDGPRGP